MPFIALMTASAPVMRPGSGCFRPSRRRPRTPKRKKNIPNGIPLPFGARWCWRRREDIDSLTEPPAAEDPAPDETLQAVLALPDDYKLPVYLYYYEGYPTAEIAQMLGTANATIRSRLNRARHKLKLTLGGA